MIPLAITPFLRELWCYTRGDLRVHSRRETPRIGYSLRSQCLLGVLVARLAASVEVLYGFCWKGKGLCYTQANYIALVSTYAMCTQALHLI